MGTGAFHFRAKNVECLHAPLAQSVEQPVYTGKVGSSNLSGRTPMSQNISILWESDFAAVIDKPAGIMVHPDGRSDEPTLCDWLVKKWPKITDVGELLSMQDGKEIRRPGIVHRLDKETSGALVIAKTQQAYRLLKYQFMNRLITKSYMVCALGTMSKDRVTIHKKIGKNPKDPRKWHAGRGAKGELRDALTLFVTKARVPKDEETGKPFTVLEAFPKTGRTHQIRVHLRSMNHPIVCDRLYGTGESVAELTRLGLHASSITLALPEHGGMWQDMDWTKASDEMKEEALAEVERVQVRAPLPADLAKAFSKNRETQALLATTKAVW